jgi:Fic-DOC domain mobile mystery protein B
LATTNVGVSEPEDVTPLDPDEAEGLRVSYIATRAELNVAEAANIAKGLRWAARRRPSPSELLDDGFLRELHRRMFSDVWSWAGRYRSTEKNIGVDPTSIAVEVRKLVADVLVWVATVTAPGAWNVNEIAVRFHHRLVCIHPFANGNGRHGRAAADLLLVGLGGEAFTWGRSNLSETGDVRDRYITALRAADSGDFSSLLTFARS